LQSIDIDNENGVEALHMLLKEVRRKYFEEGRTLYIYRKCMNQQIKSAGAGGFYLCEAQYVGRSGIPSSSRIGLTSYADKGTTFTNGFR
jgi:hypothetical protein